MRALPILLVCSVSYGQDFNFRTGSGSKQSYIDSSSIAEGTFNWNFDPGKVVTYPNGIKLPTNTASAYAAVDSAEAAHMSNITYHEPADRIHAAVRCLTLARLHADDDYAAATASKGARQVATVAPRFSGRYTLKSNLVVGSASPVNPGDKIDTLILRAASRGGFVTGRYQELNNQWEVRSTYRTQDGKWIIGETRMYPGNMTFAHARRAFHPMASGGTFAVECIARAQNDFEMHAPTSGQLSSNFVGFARVSLEK